MEGWGGISSSEMAAIDENAEWLGVPRALLMENAGAWVARIAYQWLGGLARRKVVVFCGTGNNGGDGFVAARHAAGLGAYVTAVLVGDPHKIRTPEAKMNFEITQSMKESVKVYILKDVGELEQLKSEVESADIIIDAIFGTGIKGVIQEPWRSVIQLINSSRALKISVDIPSGVDPDTGVVADLAVSADITVTFHRPKLGIPAAADYCGEVVIAPIGIPPEAEIIMGPGTTRQALRLARRETLNITFLDKLDERAARILSELGARCQVGGEARGNIVYLGKCRNVSESVKGAFGILSLGLVDMTPSTASIIDREEAGQKLGIDLDEGFIKKYDVLTRRARELEGAVYVLGDKSDLLIGDSRWQVSWINRPLNDEGLIALISTGLFLMARGMKPFNALSAAGYLAGFAAQFGCDKLIEELERLSK